MNTLSKRDVLLALTALVAGAATPTRAESSRSLDLGGGRAIGEAYLAAYPEADASVLRDSLAPNGFDAAAVQRLRARAAADFRENRLFVYQGWRLSETEGQLFALLTVD
jgi:hypothetical protein